VRPSFIRVEADEVTYNLHIMLRFELEQPLLTGDLKPADVPGVWNETFHRYFDLTPPDDAQANVADAVAHGKGFIERSVEASYPLGKGVGPVSPFWRLHDL
jgi:carboxypeptidase Taq